MKKVMEESNSNLPTLKVLRAQLTRLFNKLQTAELERSDSVRSSIIQLKRDLADAIDSYLANVKEDQLDDELAKIERYQNKMMALWNFIKSTEESSISSESSSLSDSSSVASLPIEFATKRNYRPRWNRKRCDRREMPTRRHSCLPDDHRRCLIEEEFDLSESEKIPSLRSCHHNDCTIDDSDISRSCCRCCRETFDNLADLCCEGFELGFNSMRLERLPRKAIHNNRDESRQQRLYWNECDSIRPRNYYTKIDYVPCYNRKCRFRDSISRGRNKTAMNLRRFKKIRPRRSCCGNRSEDIDLRSFKVYPRLISRRSSPRWMNRWNRRRDRRDIDSYCRCQCLVRRFCNKFGYL